MILHLVTIGIIVCSFLTLGVSGERMMGIGRWSVSDVQPCANDAEMPWMMRVRRHELNHTHDAYDADVNTLADFDDSVGIRIDACMMMDGGCKRFMTMAYDCARKFINVAARENMRRAFVLAGVDPPEFPIPIGEYQVRNFVLDMENLSKQGVYGDFISDAFITKGGQDMACLKLLLRFEQLDDWPPLTWLKSGYP
ncbi:uncharacterized protein LOC134795087 isoform X1 [Cydia splendana]|uniref:uncharacterized protein LOC134795087 isoform X1 n=1 Tax=Cydia splendana TaxID=1100963 RepID=UPI00300CE90A